MTKNKKIRLVYEPVNRFYIITSIILYVFSLPLVAFSVGNEGVYSFMALLLGPLGMIVLDGASFSWLANPCILVAWIAARAKFSNTSMYASSFALILGLMFLLFNEIVANEAGTTGTISDIQAGYWFWLISIVLILIGSANRNSKPKETPTPNTSKKDERI